LRRYRAAVFKETSNMDTQIKQALVDVRTSAHALHTAVNDAATRETEHMQADLQAAGVRARAVAESIRTALGTQSDAARKHVQLAMTSLDAFERHAEAALKETAAALRSAVSQTQGEVHDRAPEVRVADRRTHAR
jgi:tellurite resistance protein